ncbi:hypothetical protein OS493_028174 [Desmophyllum pertusum]|uniref:Uncharacterized protein n=1 Tax=Desmophyllum pertusum TaxID=174260 RepID=A0A9W9YX11_9CNID|nr:hypothetical protein OS493_028174 [Desmophyllum pertusum]
MPRSLNSSYTDCVVARALLGNVTTRDGSGIHPSEDVVCVAEIDKNATDGLFSKKEFGKAMLSSAAVRWSSKVRTGQVRTGQVTRTGQVRTGQVQTVKGGGPSMDGPRANGPSAGDPGADGQTPDKTKTA